MNALVRFRHELSKKTGLYVPIGTHSDALENRYIPSWPGIHGTKHRANRGLATPTVAYKILKAEFYKLLIWKPLGNRITTNAMAPNGAS